MKNGIKKLILSFALVAMLSSPLASAHSQPFEGTTRSVGNFAVTLVALAAVGGGIYLTLMLNPGAQTAVFGGGLATTTTIVYVGSKYDNHREEVAAAIREDAAAYVASDGTMVTALLSDVFESVNEQIHAQYGDVTVSLMDVAQGLTR